MRVSSHSRHSLLSSQHAFEPICAHDRHSEREEACPISILRRSSSVTAAVAVAATPTCRRRDPNASVPFRVSVGLVSRLARRFQDGMMRVRIWLRSPVWGPRMEACNPLPRLSSRRPRCTGPRCRRRGARPVRRPARGRSECRAGWGGEGEPGAGGSPRRTRQGGRRRRRRRRKP